jgi:putative ABC transport system permease protein
MVQGNEPTFITGSSVSADYFDLLGIKLVRGRLPNDFDSDETPPVAVIDQTMARTFWPNEDPIGQRIKLSPRATAWTTIVGIVNDAQTESLASPVVPHIYASLYQKQGKHLAIFVRGRVDQATIARQVQEQVQAINPALPVFRTTPLNEIVSRSVAVRRLSMQLLAMFATTALLLAMLGIYGVISYMVNERSHEIGVRLALGAQRREVLGLVMRQGAVLGIFGAVVGLGAAMVVSRALAGLLVGVGPADPLTFGAAISVLMIVAFAGCYVPAHRATRLDPIIALRS